MLVSTTARSCLPWHPSLLGAKQFLQLGWFKTENKWFILFINKLMESNPLSLTNNCIFRNFLLRLNVVIRILSWLCIRLLCIVFNSYYYLFWQILYSLRITKHSKHIRKSSLIAFFINWFDNCHNLGTFESINISLIHVTWTIS